MGFVEIFLIGVGLSMDAFAVSVCKGLGMHRVNYAHALVIALFFGVFQGLMPVIGWLVGSAFAVYVTAVDHWIAFALLAFVGGKMLWDAFHDTAMVEPAPDLVESCREAIRRVPTPAAMLHAGSDFGTSIAAARAAAARSAAPAPQPAAAKHQ